MSLRSLVGCFVLLLILSDILAQSYSELGRVEGEAQSIQYDWSNIEISASFEGEEIYAHISDVGNLYNVFIDGSLVSVLQTNSTTTKYLLANGLSDETHQILFTKRTEALVGIAEFAGFSDSYNQNIPIKRNTKVNRKLEVIGDSISCGYGNEGVYPCHWSPQTENSYLAYGPRLARYFEADVHLECWSGKGVVRNYGSPDITSPDPFPVYYPLTIANNPNISWDFSNWVPDAVLINLGTNDYSTQPAPPQEVFQNGYINFINFILSKYIPLNPSIQLFLACGPMIGQPCCSYVEGVAQQFSTGVTYVDLQNILVYPNDYGCDGHPNISGHEKMANATAPYIQKVMDW